MSQTFEDYWQSLVEKNPMLARGDVRLTLSTSAFKDQLKKAFKEGQQDSHIGTKNTFSDIFNGLF